MAEQYKDGYWLDSNEAENARLFTQHRHFTAALGGLLPKVIPTPEVRSVLDVGCGSGGWALDLVKQYPHMHVTGIDISETALNDARRHAQLHRMRSVSFQRMDATKVLEFHSNHFDLVHMRSASSFLSPDMWPTIITELVRVIRPGGWLNVVDYEQGPTSSDAFNHIGILSMRAVRAAGLSLSPVSLTIGAAARLYRFLQDAFLLDTSYQLHVVNFGAGDNRDAQDFVNELLVGAANIKPFLLRLGLIEPDEYDALIVRAREELARPDAYGYAYLISAIGRKDEQP